MGDCFDMGFGNLWGGTYLDTVIPKSWKHRRLYYEDGGVLHKWINTRVTANVFVFIFYILGTHMGPGKGAMMGNRKQKFLL